MQLRNISLVLFILVALICVACSSVYTTQHFSFPPETKPHENDWEYTALVVVSSSTSPITRKSKKSIQISIYDRSKTSFLKDTFELNCASIRAMAVWEKFEEIKIELVEVGNKNALDPYNQKLLNSGPNRLLEVTYQYDQGSKKYTRIN